MVKAVLLLEDGTKFECKAIGETSSVSGEVVFQTAMVGYQETFTDPSYCGQILVMTFPHLGIYGLNNSVSQSIKPWVNGIIVRDIEGNSDHYLNEGSLLNWLKSHGIPALYDIDTRELTSLIRKKGTLKGVIVTGEEANKANFQDYFELNSTMTSPVDEVINKEPYFIKGSSKRIAVLDYGIKKSILEVLIDKGYTIGVFPFDTTYEEITRFNPHGILLSNGPGDPNLVRGSFDTVKELSLRYPTMGICLGHQVLALSHGLKTDKLKFGHRGANHPVKDLTTGKFYITSQNHGYAITDSPEVEKIFEITHRSLNDGTIEGIAHKNLPVYSVQFHPEASPGPEDSRFIFNKFFHWIDIKEEILSA